MERAELKIEKCRPDAIIPTYANEGDAGMDLYASEDVIIEPGRSALISTGIKMAIPLGYEVQIRPRSGISLNTPIRVPNAPGTIDCGYRDEVKVILYNSSFMNEASDGKPFTLKTKGNRHGNYMICKGDRVAQMVFAKVTYADIKEVDSVDSVGSNRGGGFGSSGI
ncbi:MAG: dUTP diphosphatase [Clostridia bacterium]|nr:dUTP diphosphatase [Clostridia bacterium]